MVFRMKSFEEREAEADKFCRRSEVLSIVEENATLGDQLFVTNGQFSIDKVEIDLKVSERAGSYRKPFRALWTSTFVEGTSDWCEQRLQECLEFGSRGFVLRPRSDARVLTVANEADSLKVPVIKTGTVADIIDYAALAATGYDGLHVSWLPMGYTIFDFWDCESTVWFTTRWIESYIEVDLRDVHERANAFKRAMRDE